MVPGEVDIEDLAQCLCQLTVELGRVRSAVEGRHQAAGSQAVHHDAAELGTTAAEVVHQVGALKNLSNFLVKCITFHSEELHFAILPLKSIVSGIFRMIVPVWPRKRLLLKGSLLLLKFSSFLRAILRPLVI